MHNPQVQVQSENWNEMPLGSATDLIVFALWSSLGDVEAIELLATRVI